VKQNSDLTCEINCLNKQSYDLKCELQELYKQLGKHEYEQIPELHIKEYDNFIDDLHETFEYDTDDEFIEDFKAELQQESEQEPVPVQEPVPEPVQEPVPEQEQEPVERVLKISQIPCLKCGLNYNCLRCKRKLM
jgi:hypothetical protein